MRIHKSVMLQECVDNLLFKKDGVFVDCTLGSGGHSLEIMSQLDSGILICFDSDEDSIRDFAEELINLGFKKKGNEFKKAKIRVYLIRENFSNIREVLESLGIEKIDGFLADLGWSSDQLSGIPGLSYEDVQADLDMRLDQNLGVKASDLLNILSAKDLGKMFLRYSDIYGKDNLFLVERIVAQRKMKAFNKVGDLLPILDKVSRNKNEKSFYSRVFQALRIAVNAEFSNLEKLLNDSLEILNKEGKGLVITFHSGEAKILEEFLKKSEVTPSFKNKGDLFLVPSIDELRENLSARSAKLYGYTTNKV